VNLKKAEGKDVLRPGRVGRRPGRELPARRHGAARPVLRLAANPKLVYCAISGFGQRADEEGAAYDQIIQGLSGMMSVTGTPEAPLRSGYPVADTSPG
jgi:crotonobetainyl-CoA:carnitine CoA-transferase CaiB-like acyl-CoA transferase